MQKRVYVLCLLAVLLFSISGVEAAAAEIPSTEKAVKAGSEKTFLCIPTIDNQRYQLSIRLDDFKNSYDLNVILLDASGNHEKKHYQDW